MVASVDCWCPWEKGRRGCLRHVMTAHYHNKTVLCTAITKLLGDAIFYQEFVLFTVSAVYKVKAD